MPFASCPARPRSCAIGSPEVFVVSTACGARCGTTRSSSARLISRFSATASITQSHCSSFARSSSKFPGSDHRGQPRLIKRRRLRLRPAPRCRLSASLFLGAPLSLRDHIQQQRGIPAFARCAAIRDPMVPAPSTAARRTRNGCVEVSSDVAVAGVAIPMRVSLFEVSRAYGTPRKRVKSR